MEIVTIRQYRRKRDFVTAEATVELSLDEARIIVDKHTVERFTELEAELTRGPEDGPRSVARPARRPARPVADGHVQACPGAAAAAAARAELAAEAAARGPGQPRAIGAGRRPGRDRRGRGRGPGARRRARSRGRAGDDRRAEASHSSIAEVVTASADPAPDLPRRHPRPVVGGPRGLGSTKPTKPTRPTSWAEVDEAVDEQATRPRRRAAPDRRAAPRLGRSARPARPGRGRTEVEAGRPAKDRAARRRGGRSPACRPPRIRA